MLRSSSPPRRNDLDLSLILHNKFIYEWSYVRVKVNKVCGPDNMSDVVFQTVNRQLGRCMRSYYDTLCIRIHVNSI